MFVRTRRIVLAALAIAFGAGALPHAVRAAESSFDNAMMSEMTRMDSEMARAPMTGDADRDFIAMMIPHHAGAIAMATSELQAGHDPRLIRLAQEIIVTQKSEITVMRAVRADLGNGRESHKEKL